MVADTLYEVQSGIAKDEKREKELEEAAEKKREEESEKDGETEVVTATTTTDAVKTIKEECDGGDSQVGVKFLF